MTAPECDVRTTLFNQDGIKIGVFGINVYAARGSSTVPERHEIDWDGNLALRSAGRAGWIRSRHPVRPASAASKG